MEIEILNIDNKKISFILKGVTPPLANAIRRVIISEVPSMAIDDITVLENTSPMYDDILAHRLGLIPLTTDLDSYLLPEECNCGSELGCSKCRSILTLDVEAEKNSKTIYSGDLKSSDPAIKPVNPDIPIVKLAQGQKIKLESYAKLGRGKDHAKWQPISVCSYKYHPRITINEKLCDECGKCVEFCPKQILVIVDSQLKVVEELNCTMCGECVRQCPKESPAVEISWDNTTFIFNIELTGVLPINIIVKEAVNILIKKIEHFKDIISSKDNIEEKLNIEA